MLCMSRPSTLAFQQKLLSSTKCRRQLAVFLSSASAKPRKVAIVGGGLAGLSTAYHLLEQRSERNMGSPLEIDILDQEEVGMGGASAVAGGLVHPLSPRGKLIYWGREGLNATNWLVHQACASSPDSNIVLRSEIFRIATSKAQADQLQKTAEALPDLCDWMEPGELAEHVYKESELPGSAFGGLRLSNGCQVVHLPSYLEGLWAACRHLADTNASVQWRLAKLQPSSRAAILEEYDTVVWAAGAGLFQGNSGILPSMPIQLVRGQSVEIRLLKKDPRATEALLSGKYVSPLPEPNRVLVGATHEFDADPMSQDMVKQELQAKTESFGSHIWDGAVVERYTMGTRVQSQRGSRGRLPIIGKLDGSGKNWVFTGLSSRGLLYHAVYGKVLAQAILARSEKRLESECVGFDWWR